MTSLLIPEPPLQVLPTLAALVGLQEAIVLQQVHYMSLRSRDGWVTKTTAEWCDVFTFLSQRSLERAFRTLREQRLLMREQVPGGGRRARVRVDHDVLDALTETAAARGVEAGRPIRQSGGTNPPIWRDQSANLAGPIRQSGGRSLCIGDEELTAETTTDAAARRESREALERWVDDVFSEWQIATGNTDAVLDDKRRRLIRKALRSRPAAAARADCIDAVKGWRHSAYHRGDNPQGIALNSLPMLLGNAENLERFRNLERHRGPSGQIGNAAGCPGLDGTSLAGRWAAIAEQLAALVPAAQHELWLQPLHPHNDTDGALVVGLPPEIAGWVGDRFRRVLDAAAAAAGERPVVLVDCAARA